ncbi:hypothetical protein BZA77DRAFT_352705 [Pyronema omphalodes]|nr:hypothetical protein BZA77DRAFT_352705 [Pyronema omphalodes]
MKTNTTNTSAVAQSPPSTPGSSSLPPPSVRSLIARRLHHLKIRSERRKLSRAEDKTRRPVKAPISSEDSKDPIWSPVPPVDENDTTQMEVCLDQDHWDGVQEFYPLETEDERSLEIWPKSMEIDNQEEDYDCEKMILDDHEIDERPVDGTSHKGVQPLGTPWRRLP